MSLGRGVRRRVLSVKVLSILVSLACLRSLGPSRSKLCMFMFLHMPVSTRCFESFLSDEGKA